MISVKPFRFNKVNLSGTMHVLLLASSYFSCILLISRMLVTESLEYIFLPWNLFLAFIPYWITQSIIKKDIINQPRLKLFIVLAGWLLFIPNSFYIITDLFH